MGVPTPTVFAQKRWLDSEKGNNNLLPFTLRVQGVSRVRSECVQIVPTTCSNKKRLPVTVNAFCLGYTQ